MLFLALLISICVHWGAPSKKIFKETESSSKGPNSNSLWSHHEYNRLISQFKSWIHKLKEQERQTFQAQPEENKTVRG